MAPAKLTTRLRVVGVRDDGYHLLDAEMVTVDLCDELEITPGDGLQVIDDVAWSGDRSPARANLSRRAGPDLVDVALAAVERSALIRLTKRIPAGAGLGGGSADAAAVLRWAGCLDPAVAVRIGADVPFCVVGGRAEVAGIGEVLSPLPPIEQSYLLVIPRLHVSTPAVFAFWDTLGGPTGDHDNDLEPAALVVEPRLEWWRDMFADVAGERPYLAGSGGTWWVAGSTRRLNALAQTLERVIAGARESAVVRVVSTVAAF